MSCYNLHWHPVRSNLLAVATSDGLIDLWGPRLSWKMFAPDFQDLQHNVAYVEAEDELDKDSSGKYLLDGDHSNNNAQQQHVCILFMLQKY